MNVSPGLALRMLTTLVVAIAGCGSACASSLDISWVRTAYTQLPGNDGLEVTGGGTDPSVLVTSGLDVAATTYQASASVEIEPRVVRTYSSSYTSFAGGTVAYGYMSGVVDATIRSTYGGNEFSRAFLRANWIDMVTMVPDDPALLGTAGSAIGGVLLDYTIDATASGFELDQFGQVSSASNLLSFLITIGSGAGPGSGPTYGENCAIFASQAPGCSNGPGPFPPQRRTILVQSLLSFVWGTPFELTAELTAESMSRTGLTPSSDPAHLVFIADGSMDFLSTVLWQGITDARDSGNNPVSFTLTSDSGTNWAQPATAVPAPGAFALLLTALAGVAASSKRRPSRPCSASSTGRSPGS